MCMEYLTPLLTTIRMVKTSKANMLKRNLIIDVTMLDCGERYFSKKRKKRKAD